MTILFCIKKNKSFVYTKWLESNRDQIVCDALCDLGGLARLCLVVVKGHDNELLRLDTHDARSALLAIDAAVIGTKGDELWALIMHKTKFSSYLVFPNTDSLRTEPTRITESLEDGRDLLGGYSWEVGAFGPDGLVLADEGCNANLSRAHETAIYVFLPAHAVGFSA